MYQFLPLWPRWNWLLEPVIVALDITNYHRPPPTTSTSTTTTTKTDGRRTLANDLILQHFANPFRFIEGGKGLKLGAGHCKPRIGSRNDAKINPIGLAGIRSRARLNNTVLVVWGRVAHGQAVVVPREREHWTNAIVHQCTGARLCGVVLVQTSVYSVACCGRVLLVDRSQLV